MNKIFFLGGKGAGKITVADGQPTNRNPALVSKVIPVH